MQKPKEEQKKDDYLRIIDYLPEGKAAGELPEERKMKYWNLMGDGVFRFSVGIEDAEDLIADLAQALDSIGK